MIQAAMIFALGFSVCGLIALAASSALARRTRRIAEQRVKQRFSTKRLEFETERDELRARHAIIVQRLERDVRDLGDQSTAYRLESALKDMEISALNSELDAKEDETDDMNDRLEVLHDELRESERKLAESGTALRAARHALQTNASEAALGPNPYAKAMNDDDTDQPIHAPDRGNSVIEIQPGVGTDLGETSLETENINKVASEIRRMATEKASEFDQMAHIDDAVGQQKKPVKKATLPPVDPDISATPPPYAPGLDAIGGKLEMLDPHRREVPPTPPSELNTGAENRFHNAMEQIRTLKKAGGGKAAE